MSGRREQPPHVPLAEMLRDMHNHAGTRVWERGDVERYAEEQEFLRRLYALYDTPECVADREFIRERRLTFLERRTKIGKLKMAALIAVGGAVIAWAVPILLQWARTL